MGAVYSLSYQDRPGVGMMPGGVSPMIGPPRNNDLRNPRRMADLSSLLGFPFHHAIVPPPLHSATTVPCLVNLHKESIKLVHEPLSPLTQNDNSMSEISLDDVSLSAPTPAPAPAPAPSSVPPPSSGLEAPSDETTNPTQDPPTVANHMTAPPFVRDIPYQLEFTFDSAEPCTITVYFLASDNGEVRNGLSGKMQSVPVSFPGGLSQVFRLPLEGFLSLSPHKPEALAYDAAESTYPFIITLRTLAERDVPVCIRQQITYTTVLLCGDGTYAIKTLHQRIRYGGASYGLHDVYGVDTGHAQDAEGTRECVVCLTEPRDTTVLPCRHMCLCHPCAETMRTQTNKCPICRAPVKALLKIALPPSDEKGSPRTWSSSAGVSCPPSAAAAALGAGSIEIGSTITHEEEEEEEEEELVNNRRTSRGAADPEVPM